MLLTDLLAARAQMAVSLAFHIVFAIVGIGMPLAMVLAEWRHLRTGDPIYLEIAKRWSKGTAIMFAVGAVSGTILSFELGLLWPEFMALAGPIIGMPFSLEGFAFFLEAIFLGIYLYGWDRISARAHLAAGVMVAVSGALSGIFVVIANAWMNTPTGFRMVDGRAIDIDPIAAVMNPAAAAQTVHMTLAAYAATGFAVAGVHALSLLKRARTPRERAFHERALTVALWFAIPAALVQPLSGHSSAQVVAETQPAKLAAMEALFVTQARAPLLIGGIPDVETQRVHLALEIPGGLSFLSFNRFDAVVAGLDQVPRADWPNVALVHACFQAMVGMGSAMALVALWALVRAWRRRDIAQGKPLLWALVATSPFGVLATEAGWMVTEVGRQPWVIQGVMRTKDAVTPMPGLVWPFLFFTVLYVLLAAAVVFLLYRQIVVVPVVEQGEARP